MQDEDGADGDAESVGEDVRRRQNFSVLFIVLVSHQFLKDEHHKSWVAAVDGALLLFKEGLQARRLLGPHLSDRGGTRMKYRHLNEIA